MKNKLKILTAGLFLVTGVGFAQTGIGTLTPDSSAVLDVASTTKGLLLPRHTTDTRDAIVSPANGLIIFNTTTNQLQTNTGTPSSPIWTASGVGATGAEGISAYQVWLNAGNIGTEAQFLASLIGAQGPQGIQGADGATGPQGPAGTDASVTGTSPINVVAGVVSLNDAGVTTAKLAEESVTSAKILDGTVATTDIANNAVTIAKLPTGATNTTYLKGDGTWGSPAIKGLVNCDGTLTQTVNNANVTATSTITLTYEDASGDIIYTTIKNRVVGTSFTIQFAAIPPSSAKINYTIVQ